METAYIGGTFDLFHVGHINLLRRAKEKFGRVVVALNSDAFSSRYKRPPVMSFLERKTVLEACRYVDEVVVNLAGEDSRLTIEKYAPCAIIHGDDWVGDSLMKQMGLTKEWMSEHGARFCYFPYTPGVSTTDIIKRIREGYAMSDL